MRALAPVNGKAERSQALSTMLRDMDISSFGVTDAKRWLIAQTTGARFGGASNEERQAAEKHCATADV
ncbi:MAG: hypothetical protein ABSE69_19705 [Roseiarcus sp.]